MSQRSVISDLFKFAVERRSLAGSTPIARFDRLADALSDTEGMLSWEVDGESALDGGSVLRLMVKGELRLCCQRCLGALSWPVEINSVLKLVRPGVEIADDELEIDEYDVMEASSDMDVLALIEDELLLAAPVAPRHQVCDAPGTIGGGRKESSFAALSRLQKRDET